MTALEPRTFGIGSDCSTNWATTTGPCQCLVCLNKCWNDWHIAESSKVHSSVRIPATVKWICLTFDITSTQVSIFAGDSAPVIEEHLPPISIQIPTMPRPETASSSSHRSEMVVEVHTSEKEELEHERKSSSGSFFWLKTQFRKSYFWIF